MSETINWAEIGRRLREPFNPEDVDFRPQGGGNSNGKAQVVAYVDARAIQDRLDEVVGPGAWEFTYEPLFVEKGQVQIAKGRLTIYGVSKEDVGEASNFDPSKGCVSDALKRAAVAWGIGRYIYSIGSSWVTLNQYKQIEPDDVRKLRAKLPRPSTAPAATRAPVASPVAETTERPYVAAPVERPVAPAQTQQQQGTERTQSPATEQQIMSIRKLCQVLNKQEPAPGISYSDARALISQLSAEYQQQRRSEDSESEQQQNASASAEGALSMSEVYDRAKGAGVKGTAWLEMRQRNNSDPARISAELDEMKRKSDALKAPAIA